MTVDQIAAAIRELTVPERLRVIEIVARESIQDVRDAAGGISPGGVGLIERHGLLIVDTNTSLPLEAFDHRSEHVALTLKLASSTEAR